MLVSGSYTQALNAHHQMNLVQQDKSDSMVKIATAQKINAAADGAVREVMDMLLAGETASLSMASSNSLDGISLTDSANSTLDGATDLIMRAEELAVKAGSDTLSDEDRRIIDREMESIKESLNELSSSSDFNGQAIFGESFSIQAGTTSSEAIEVAFDELSTEALALDDVSLSTQEGAQSALSTLDNALNSVISAQADAGNASRQLRSRHESLGIRNINLSAARSRIGDADMAATLTEFAQHQLREAAATKAMKAAQNTMGSMVNLFG